MDMDESESWIYLCIGIAALAVCFCLCCVDGCKGDDSTTAASSAGPIVYGQGPDRVESDRVPFPADVPTAPEPVDRMQGYIVLTDPTTGRQQVYAPVATPMVLPAATNTTDHVV